MRQLAEKMIEMVIYSTSISRYGGQDLYVRQVSGRSDLECMQGAGTVVHG